MLSLMRARVCENSMLLMHKCRGFMALSLLCSVQDFSVSRQAWKWKHGFQWPNRECPVAFIDCTGLEQRVSLSSGSTAGTSYQNDAEAQLVAHAVQQLLSGPHAMQPSDIGVITPYSGQVRAIKTVLEQASTSRTQPDVKSVDGFQGQEKEVIIFSAVRSNAQGRIGFLADVRRLNVALTRARRGLIVIGSKSTLMNNPTWRSWLRWAGYKDVTTNFLEKIVK